MPAKFPLHLHTHSFIKDVLKYTEIQLHLQSSKAVTKVKLLKGHIFPIVLQLRKVNSKALFERLYQQNRTQSQDNGLLHAEGQAIQTSEIDVAIIAQLRSQWDRGQTFLQLILHCNFNRLTIFPLKISMGNWKFSAGWPAKSKPGSMLCHIRLMQADWTLHLVLLNYDPTKK